MVASSKKTAKPVAKKTAAKKTAAPKAKKVTAAKTVTVSSSERSTMAPPRHRKTAEKYAAPTVVRKPVSREQQAAQDNYRLRGQ